MSLLEALERDECDGEAGCSDPRTTRTEYVYNVANGNLTARIDWGEWDVTAVGAEDVDVTDTRHTQLQYTPPNGADYILDRVEKSWLRQGGVVGAGATFRETEFYYDNHSALGVAPEEGNVTKRVVLLGSTQEDPTTTFSYDPYGNLTAVTDPRSNAGEGGGTTQYAYDADGAFVQSVTNALGHQTIVGYAPDLSCSLQLPAGAGLVHSLQGPNDIDASEQRTLCRDAFGRVLSNEAPGGLALMTYEYDDTPRQASVTTIQRTKTNGSTSESTSYLDWVGRTYRVESDAPQGQTLVSEFTFGRNGQLASKSLPYFDGPSPDPQFTQYSYDPLGRETSMTLPGAGRVYTTEYGKGLVTRKDPLNVEKRTSISPFGQILAVEEDNGAATYRTDYEYNVAGELEKVTDHLGNVTDPTWDRAGRKLSLIDPDVGTTLYEYYADGSLKSQTDAAGTVVSFDYDALGRIAWRDINEGAGAVRDFSFYYDSAIHGKGRFGNRVRVSDEYGYRVLEYDLLGRPIEERTMAGGSYHTFTNEYSQTGELEKRMYPNGPFVKRNYDSRGFLTDINLSGGVIANNLGWHPTGALASWTSGNGYRTAKTFESDTARLDTLQITDLASMTTVEQFDYGFTLRDRVSSIEDLYNADPDRDRSFVYDDLGRLTSATGPYQAGYSAKTLLYDYDAIGNLLCKGATDLGNCDGTGGLTFTGYGTPGAHAPTTISGAAVSHDALGNLTSRGTKSYGYNALGQLSDVTDGATNQLTDMQYDFDGRRIATVDHSSGSPVTRYLITPDFEWVADASPQMGRIHVSLAGTHIATHERAHAPGSGCAGTWPAVLLGPGDVARDILILFGPGLFAVALVLLGGPLRRRLPTLRPVGAMALGTAGLYFVAVNAQLVFFGPLTREASASPPLDTWFYHSNHLGSTSLVTYSDGSVVGQAIYKPFGEVVPDTVGGSTDAPQFGFTSQRFEKAAGIYDYNARWYDPEIGRFLQPDSIVPDPFSSQSLNRYSYVMNDPVNLIDPTGHFVFAFFASIVTFSGLSNAQSGAKKTKKKKCGLKCIIEKEAAKKDYSWAQWSAELNANAAQGFASDAAKKAEAAKLAADGGGSQPSTDTDTEAGGATDGGGKDGTIVVAQINQNYMNPANTPNKLTAKQAHTQKINDLKADIADKEREVLAFKSAMLASSLMGNDTINKMGAEYAAKQEYKAKQEVKDLKARLAATIAAGP